jgi:hypothetical protein
MLELTPWTYFVKTNHTQRTYYRFNGLESVTRLSQFLQNETKWESMEVKGQVPSVVGLFGLYQYYITRDLTKIFKKHPLFFKLIKLTGFTAFRVTGLIVVVIALLVILLMKVAVRMLGRVKQK